MNKTRYFAGLGILLGVILSSFVSLLPETVTLGVANEIVNNVAIISLITVGFVLMLLGLYGKE